MTIESDLVRLAKAKENLKEMAEEVAELEDALIAALEAKDRDSVSTRGLKGTLVRGSRVVTDDDALKKALGATWWNKITKRVLDKEKLEAFVATGQIDAATVAAASEEKFNKPYIRVSGKLEVPAPAPVVRGRKKAQVP